ncbi:MAG: membrane protein insertase YidC [Clostridia bacterium]|nr:membrane protein insertase YidC [Clostridia bacterium]
MFQKLIVVPLGYILGFIYQFVGSYGWSLIIFTVLVKLLLLPLGLKQQKSTTKMQQVQPKLLEIQSKYANDQQKLSEETMKLYKEYGVSPMGGCLPLLIQLPILFGLYRVIYKPITFMLHKSAEEVAALTEQYAANPEFIEKFGQITGKAANQAEILIAKAFDLVNFDFLGLDISATPNLANPSLLWLIPVIAAVTTYLSSKITTLMSGNDKKGKEKEEEKKPERILSPDQKKTGSASSAESMTKSMTIMMPLMTLWITFTFPATIGVYWSISNILSLLQTILLNGYYKNKMQAEVAVKSLQIEQEKAAKKAKYNHKKR